MNYEPSITLALDEECRTQLRLSVETRTSRVSRSDRLSFRRSSSACT